MGGLVAVVEVELDLEGEDTAWVGGEEGRSWASGLGKQWAFHETDIRMPLAKTNDQ